MRDLLDRIAGILAEADDEPLVLPPEPPDTRSDLAKAEKAFYQVVEAIEAATGVKAKPRVYDRDDPNDLIDAATWEIQRGYSDFEASGIMVDGAYSKSTSGPPIDPTSALSLVENLANELSSFKTVDRRAFVPLEKADERLWKGAKQVSFSKRLRLPTVMIEVKANSCSTWAYRADRVLGVRVGDPHVGRAPTVTFSVTMTRLASWTEKKDRELDSDKDHAEAKILFDQAVARTTKIVGRPPSETRTVDKVLKATWKIDIDMADLKAAASDPWNYEKKVPQGAPDKMKGVGLKATDAQAKAEALEATFAEMPTKYRATGDRKYGPFDVDDLRFLKKARWPGASVTIECRAIEGSHNFRGNVLNQGVTFTEPAYLFVEISLADIDVYGDYDNLERRRNWW